MKLCECAECVYLRQPPKQPTKQELIQRALDLFKQLEETVNALEMPRKEP